MNQKMQMNMFQPTYKLRSIISELWDRSDVTPDLVDIRKCEYIPVFIYDNLKGSFDHAPKVFENSIYLGDAFSAAENFKMYTNAAGDAIVFPKVNHSLNKSWGKIKGCVWAVPPETLMVLDRYHENTYHYLRRKFNYFLTDQVEQVTRKGNTLRPSLSCWTYVGMYQYYFPQGNDNPFGLKLKNILVSYSHGKNGMNGKEKTYYSHWQGLY